MAATPTIQELIAVAKINGACEEAHVILGRIRKTIDHINRKPARRITLQEAGGAIELAQLAEWMVNRIMERMKSSEEIIPS